MADRRIVRVEEGVLRGLFGYDPRITVFKGVPYAAPPIGKNRWRSPQPVEHWEGVRECYEYGPMSVQSVPGADPNEFWTRELHPCGPEFDMEEDCLYVNIFSPAKTPDEKLPVFFYIHGGGYRGGYPFEQEFDWERFAAKGVVVVTVAYRLGVMGFFAHPELSAENPDAPKGNFGIEDQFAAIRWTKKNIAAFGGDPDRITIAGQSAGSGSVLSLLTSPLTRGYIQGAIVQSGINVPFADLKGTGRPQKTMKDAEELGRTFLENLGIGSIEEARKVNAKWLVDNEAKALGPGMHFAPIEDGIFLTESVIDAVKKGDWDDIPVIFGYNAGEMKMFNRMMGGLPQTVAEFETYAEAFGDKKAEFLAAADVKNDDNVKALFATDAYLSLKISARYAALKFRELGRRAYIYEFDADMPGTEDRSSFHGAELWFAYDSLGRSWRPFEGKHYDLCRQMNSYWVNFVKKGDPNGKDHFGYELPAWGTYTEDEPNIMFFRDKAEPAVSEPDKVMKMRLELNR